MNHREILPQQPNLKGGHGEAIRLTITSWKGALMLSAHFLSIKIDPFDHAFLAGKYLN